jgi:hypothetical protein
MIRMVVKNMAFVALLATGALGIDNGVAHTPPMYAPDTRPQLRPYRICPTPPAYMGRSLVATPAGPFHHRDKHSHFRGFRDSATGSCERRLIPKA